MVAEGYEVLAVAPQDKHAPRLAELCCRFIAMPMDNQGTHPIRDGLLLWRFWVLLRRERPAVFLGYTVKPNVYGSLAAHMLSIPVVNNIAGLGAVFIRDNWLTRVVRWLYKLSLSRSATVFFQNEDDRKLFVEAGLVKSSLTDILPGSGINLRQFAATPLLQNGTIRFLLIARMLWDKGVGEYVAAARLLKARHPDAEFCLLGFLDVQNPAAIPRSQMDLWVSEGSVTYLGETDDVRPYITAASCVVLPSFYREGTPRTLLEAAAMARPIVTTDAVGCRDVVDDGVNGYLCRPKDAIDLAERMERIIALSPEERSEMGRRGREKVESEYDENIVIKKYLAAIVEIVGCQMGQKPC